MSITVTVKASEVPFNRLIKLFPKFGIATIKAEGKIIRRIVCRSVSPIDFAASISFGSTDKIAARKVSELYAASLRPKATKTYKQAGIPYTSIFQPKRSFNH